MYKLPRQKKTAPRERTATPAELEEERQRWIRATMPPSTRETVAALRADLERTQESPAVTMHDLVFGGEA